MSNDFAMAMMAGVLTQLAEAALETYTGPRDRASLEAHGEKLFESHVIEKIPELLAELEIHPEDVPAEGLRELFVGPFVSLGIKHEPRGSHEVARVAWVPFGKENASGPSAPPPAIHIDDYVVAYDPTLGGIVYAPSPEYHRFGHAYLLGSDGFRQIGSRVFAVGSAAQRWMGAFDATRGGVVAWNVDGMENVPIGVLVREGGLTVYLPKGHRRAEDDPATRVVFVVDAPTIEGEWSDLKALFGYDEARAVWVMLSPSGLHEFDRDNRWQKVLGPEDLKLLPDSIEGDRLYGSGGAGTIWDAPRKRLVFWFAVDRALALVAWDGSKMTAVPTDGLPAKPLASILRPAGGVVASHPVLGIALYLGPEEGFFRIGPEGTWISEPAGTGAPPKSKATSLALAPDGTALLGPGSFVEEGGTSTKQAVFYVRRGAEWTRIGRIVRESPLVALRYGTGCVASAGGSLIATAAREGLTTLRWKDAGWQTVVDARAGAAIFAEGSPDGGSRVALLEGPNERLFAISDEGAVFCLEDSEWRVLAKRDDAFGSRRDFRAAYDPSRERVVIWGGAREHANTTSFFEKGAWRTARPGPRPVDLRYNRDEHRFAVDFALTFDSALGRVVRLGYDEIGVLDGDTWRPCSPPYLADHLSPTQRALVHDKETRETLIVCFDTGYIIRLDLAGCDLVGQVEPAPEIKGSDHQTHTIPFRECAYDAKTRTIYTFFDADDDVRYSLDLSSAFARAATLGPRTTELPPAAPRPLRLYRPQGDGIIVFYADGDTTGATVATRRGLLGPSGLELTRESMHVEKAAEEMTRLDRAQRAEGFVSAEGLDKGLLERVVGAESYGFEVSEDESAELSPSRFGGLPSGIAVEDWPKDDDGHPLGFLLQIELPPTLYDGGVAVFVKTDGTATESDDNSVAILVPRVAFAGPPLAEKPEDVFVLPPRAITRGARAVEIDRQLVHALGEEDGDLADALAALAKGEERRFDKIGGYPEWIQGAAAQAGEQLLVQIDFDTRSFDEEGWENVGLAGGLYVLRTRRGVRALFQYT